MANVKIGPEEQKNVVSMYQGGVTATKIAAQLHVDLDTVCRALRREGVHVVPGRRRQVTKAQAKQMADCYLQGMSTLQIGEKFSGINAGTVTRYLREQGVEIRQAGFQQGEDHHAWRGGRIHRSDGYILVRVHPDHQFFCMAAEKMKGASYVLEHRLVMAEYLGRPLREDETVHHIDGDKTNNDRFNLQVRQGRHGKGVVAYCGECGSQNIVSGPIADT